MSIIMYELNGEFASELCRVIDLLRQGRDIDREMRGGEQCVYSVELS